MGGNCKQTHALFDICIAYGNQTASIACGRINEFKSVSLPNAVSIARSDLNSLSNTRAFHISASAVVANNKQSLSITTRPIFYITFIHYALDDKRFLLSIMDLYFFYISITILLMRYILRVFLQNFMLLLLYLNLHNYNEQFFVVAFFIKE